MAHRAHSIPWQTLTNNLKFMHCNPRNNGVTNLYLRKGPDAERELQYFANGFARALSSYTVIERKKYTQSSIVPNEDDRVISQAAAKKMSATIFRYNGQLETEGHLDLPCEALSEYDCTPRRFISDTYPYESDMNNELQDCCELTKTLLLYGEMDALFQLAAHPEVRFYRLWDGDIYANAEGFGVKKLMDAMLQAYLCLNVMVLKPELFDHASRRAFLDAETKAHRTTFSADVYDYRLTAAYQRMLLCCTGITYGAESYEAHTYPHREFFGVPRGMFRTENSYLGQQTNKAGTGRVSDIAQPEFRSEHLASKADFVVVLGFLKSKGLPTEIALQILGWAEYKSAGRLWHRDDPLHAENADELKKYLSFCWKVLVRIDMLVQACGKTLDWETEVADAMCALFELGRTGRRKGWRQRAMCDWGEFGKHSERVVFVSQ